GGRHAIVDCRIRQRLPLTGSEDGTRATQKSLGSDDRCRLDNPDRVPMHALRICHLGKYYPPAPGGIETHVRTLAQAQAAQGAQVQVYCINHEPGPTVIEDDGPVKVMRLRRAFSAAKFDVCPDLVRALSRVEADVLHVQVPNPTMLLGLVLAGAR